MRKFLEYIFSLLLILTTNTVYMVKATGNMSDYIRILFSIILGLLIITYLILGVSSRKKIAKAIIFLIFYYFYILIFTLITDTKINLDYFHIYFLTFPMLYFLFSTIQKKDVANLLTVFSRTVYYLCIVSLFFFFLGTTLNILKVTSSELIDWGKVQTIPSYFNLHFNIQTVEIFGKSFIRNTGIFAEAPMFSLNIVIALAIEIFLKKDFSKKYCLLLIVTLLTTASTTGLIICAFIIFMYFWLRKSIDTSKFNIKYLIVVFLSIFLIFVVYSLLIDKQKTASYYARMDDYIASYKAWMDYPILGNGYKNSDAIIFYMSNFRKNNIGLSNSIMVLLAQGGIYLFLLYLIPALKTFKYGLKTKNNNIIIFDIIIIMLFATTIFMYKPLIFYFLALGYSLQKGEKTNEV